MSLPNWDRKTLARMFMAGDIDAPASEGDAQLMPTTVRSGHAASLHNGVSHMVAAAALAVDADAAVLVTRWECSGGSVNAVPVTDPERFASCANCAEAIRYPRGPVVYRCLDDAGEVIYIGSSVNLRQRVRGHRTQSGWWDEVADVTAEQFPTESACRLAEAKAIRAERPFYNRNGVRGVHAASP